MALVVMSVVGRRLGASVAGVLASGPQWPNDVLIGTDETKVAGILAERVAEWRVVVGMGLKCVVEGPEHPSGGAYTAYRAAGCPQAPVSRQTDDRRRASRPER